MMSRVTKEEADAALETIARMRGDLAQWEALRASAAKTIGEDPQTWPDHGNAPLAISAALALRSMTPLLTADELTALIYDVLAAWVKRNITDSVLCHTDGTIILPKEVFSLIVKMPLKYEDLEETEKQMYTAQILAILKVIQS